MGINLSSVMLLMGAGMAQDVGECGNIRILGLYLQDHSHSFNYTVGPGMPFETNVSDFMYRMDSAFPGSMFGIYGFTDRGYSAYNPTAPTEQEPGDFVKLTSLVDIPTAASKLSELDLVDDFDGKNSDAFDVMYHLIINSSDSGIDSVTPLADTYDAKVLYVSTDGIPQYLEGGIDGCSCGINKYGWGCANWCESQSTRCCTLDSSTGVATPVTSKVDYGSAWNPTAECPIDLATLGKVINDNDWYVVYIATGGPYELRDNVLYESYNWSKQIPLMGIESRFVSFTVDYNYTGLSDLLVNSTSKIMCSAIPSNNPSGLPTAGPTTSGPTTSGPTTAPATGGPTTAPATGGPTTAPATQSGQEGTTTTTGKPFPVGLVCGCAAGALAAIAGGAVAANRLTGYPQMPEFEFEGDEGVEREESQREAQVAMGEADFA